MATPVGAGHLSKATAPGAGGRTVFAVLGIWIGLMALAGAGGYWKLVGISAIACTAMLAGAAASTCLPVRLRRSGWADGLAAGAMLTSACLFLLPLAVRGDAAGGGLGVAVGLLSGTGLAGLARASDRHSPLDPAVSALSLHALGAGLVIGIVYGRMPDLGAALGVAIVSHKLPAGYAAVHNLRRHGQPLLQVVLPACAVGLASLPVALLIPPGETGYGTPVFGFATGIFLQVAMAFLVAGGNRMDSQAANGTHRRSFAAGVIAGMAAIVTLWRLVA